MISQSEHAVFPYLAHIKATCMVENALENGVRKLRKRFYNNYSVTAIQGGSVPLSENGIGGSSTLSMASGASLDYVMGVPPPPSLDGSNNNPTMKKKSIGRTPSFYSTKFLLERDNNPNEF